jgi:hypothetical protein
MERGEEEREGRRRVEKGGWRGGGWRAGIDFVFVDDDFDDFSKFSEMFLFA